MHMKTSFPETGKRGLQKKLPNQEHIGIGAVEMCER